MINPKKKITFTFCLFFTWLLAAQEPASTELRVLYIGDSITDGNWGGGGATPSGERNHWDQNHLFGSGYMYLCAAHYMGYYPDCNYRFYNRGISGHTLAHLIARWEEDVIALKPDVLSILVGVNDVEYFINDPQGEFDLQVWEQSYRELLDRTLAQIPSVKLVIGSPFAAGIVRRESQEDAIRYDSLIRSLAQITEKIASDYQAEYLNYYGLFTDSLAVKFPTVPVIHWLWDGVHPTAAAHRHMADLWIKQMDRWMLP